MSYINIVEPTLYMANVSNNDVRSVIHGLKNSSSGWDGLSAYRTQNFIQHNYKDLSTNIPNIKCPGD